MSSISIIENYSGFKLRNKRKLKQVYKKLTQDRGLILGDISIVFMTDEELLEINKQYLNHDYFTDIITFDYSEGKTISGDLMISIDMVKFNADKFKTDFVVELHRVLFHGLLHLLGLKDKTDKESNEMRLAENAALDFWVTL